MMHVTRLQRNNRLDASSVVIQGARPIAKGEVLRSRAVYLGGDLGPITITTLRNSQARQLRTSEGPRPDGVGDEEHHYYQWASADITMADAYRRAIPCMWVTCPVCAVANLTGPWALALAIRRATRGAEAPPGYLGAPAA